MSNVPQAEEKFTPASSGSPTTDHRDRERADFFREAHWTEAIRALAIAFAELEEAELELRHASCLDGGILADDLKAMAKRLNEVRKKAIKVRQSILTVVAQ